jgi:phage terminase large subunit
MSGAVEREQFIPNSPFQGHTFWSWAPIVAILGRIGSSKTRSMLEAADYDCRTWAGNRVAVCRKIAVDLFSTVKEIFDAYVLHEDELRWWKEHRMGGAMVSYPNGSHMRWFGLDNPGKALSAEYGSIYVDQAEELDFDEMKAVEGRVRLRRPPAGNLPLRRRTVYAFNAMGDRHWANARFGFKAMQSPGGVQSRDPRTWEHRRIIRTQEPVKLLDGRTIPPGELLAEVLIAEPDANVENLSTDYQLRIAAQAGPWYDRFVLGLVGSFEGQAFPNFSEQTHVLADPPPEWGWQEWGGYPPPTWKRYRSVDFGYENPFVMQWFTRVPEDNPRCPGAFVLYQEIYMTHRIVSVHARQARAWDAEEVAALNRGIERANRALAPGERRIPLKERLSFSQQVSDHDAEDRATLESEGIITDPAVKDRSSGIQVVYNALEPTPQPRLLFMRNARREADPALKDKETAPPTCTWQEFPGLRWPKTPTQDDKAPKEDIVKVNDHGFDAVRYHLRTFRDRGEMKVVRLYETSRDDD